MGRQARSPHDREGFVDKNRWILHDHVAANDGWGEHAAVLVDQGAGDHPISCPPHRHAVSTGELARPWRALDRIGATLAACGAP